MIDDSTWSSSAVTRCRAASIKRLGSTASPFATARVGERQSRSVFRVTFNSRRRAGKPFAEARLRRDRIVAYVRHLQETEPSKLDDVIVPMTANFFGVSERTVWNALAEDRKLGSAGIIDLGPMTAQWTASTRDQ